MTITIHNIKKITRRRMTASVTFALIALVGNTLAYQQPAVAAATAPGNPGTSSSSSSSSSVGGSSESSNGEYQPYNMYISPKGHVVSAFEPIRSPSFCYSIFAVKKATGLNIVFGPNAYWAVAWTS